MQSNAPLNIDVIESGQGPLAVLVHSSVSGARQWRKLSDTLSSTHCVKAVNLFGYGHTPPWTQTRPQTLADQAALVTAVVSGDAAEVSLVGHSLGGTVAMKAAAMLGAKVKKLVLIEPNPFFLLRDNNRAEAFAEAMRLRDIVKQNGSHGDWAIAAECFADYWGGAGTWSATSPKRRAVFAEALKPNWHEWDVVEAETTPLDQWAELLPRETLVVHDPATVRPIREIVELLKARTAWRFVKLPRGGHMAPLTHPELVNPIVAEFLCS